MNKIQIFLDGFYSDYTYKKYIICTWYSLQPSTRSAPEETWNTLLWWLIFWAGEIRCHPNIYKFQVLHKKKNTCDMCWLHKIKSTSFFVIVLLFVPRRERTKLVYSMYSRMSGETVKRNLMKLGVDFFVLEDSWCTRRTRYLDIINALFVYIFFTFGLLAFIWCFNLERITILI